MAVYGCFGVYGADSIWCYTSFHVIKFNFRVTKSDEIFFSIFFLSLFVYLCPSVSLSASSELNSKWNFGDFVHFTHTHMSTEGPREGTPRPNGLPVFAHDTECLS